MIYRGAVTSFCYLGQLNKQIKKNNDTNFDLKKVII